MDQFPMTRRNLLVTGAAAACASVISTTSSLADGAEGPRVFVKQGQLEGVYEDGLSVWKGVPYAAPPVGPNRWRPPQPAAAWDGVRKADAFGPPCVQKTAPAGPEHALGEQPQSEDCLTLNIWAPRDATPGSLPVMVWIHGGSFRFGTGALDQYHGQHLAPRGAVVVTLNYRLGLFGTFSHPALRQSGEEEGNFGLQDQIAALEWVKENIRDFGGNPDNVTFFGESAGGVSVSYLMSSPRARGLFHKAIVESGGLSIPLYDRSEADAIGKRVVGDLGLGADATAEELRNLTPEQLRDVAYGPADVMPIKDGNVIEQTMAEAFAEGNSGEIPLLIGWNTDEAGFFGPRYWKGLADILGADRYEKLRAQCFGWGTLGPDASAEQIASEWFAGTNSRQMALTHRGPVHAYRFGFVPAAMREEAKGAIHTAEIRYVFGHVGADDTADPQARAVSNELADRWVAFARSGDPDVESGIQWEALNELGTNFLLIDNDRMHVGPDPAASLDDAITAMDLPPRP